MEQRARLLVTGGTGHAGRPLVQALLNRGYRVRVVTSVERPPEPGIEWWRMNWLESLAFDAAVEGCDAVLHLGAELGNVAKMRRVNVEATRALAKAAERGGVRFFCYTSSISVYGSPRTRVVTEASPVVTTDGEGHADYRAEPYMLSYARTKLMGERVIGEEALMADYVIFRPARIYSLDDILAIGQWSLARKILCGYRQAHHVYERDVAHAIIWFMERALDRPEARRGVEIFNLSNDDADTNTFACILRKAYRLTGDKRFHCPFIAPPLADIAKDVLKYRHLTFRYPLGMVRISPEKLYGTGYRFPIGITAAQDLSIRAFIEARAAKPPSL